MCRHYFALKLCVAAKKWLRTMTALGYGGWICKLKEDRKSFLGFKINGKNIQKIMFNRNGAFGNPRP